MFHRLWPIRSRNSQGRRWLTNLECPASLGLCELSVTDEAIAELVKELPNLKTVKLDRY
jgi:hypothetical protein